jgi:hypothetical protein
LERQAVVRAESREWEREGRRIERRRAIIAMTMRSSMREKAGAGVLTRRRGGAEARRGEV